MIYLFFLICLALVGATSMDYIETSFQCLNCLDGNPSNSHVYCEKYDQEEFDLQSEGLNEEESNSLFLWNQCWAQN